MATRTIANGGGNYNALSTWVEGAVPTSADAVVATSTSGQLTINVTANAASVDFTNYTNTLTLSAAVNWTVAGNVTLVSGMTITGSSTSLVLNTSSSIRTNGKLWTGNITTSGTVTITLLDDLNLNGLLSINGTSITLTTAGVFNIYTGGLTLGTGCVLQGTAALVFNKNGTITCPGTTSLIKIPVTINTSGTVILATIVALSATTFTYTAGTVTVTGNTTTFTGCTINSAGMTWNNVTIDGSVTLSSLLTTNGTLNTTNSSNVTVGGSGGFSVATLSNGLNTTGRTFGLAAGVTYTIRTSFLNPNGTAVLLFKFVSNTPGTKAILTLNQGATQDIPFLGATDIDSSNGQTIWPYKTSGITTSLNWQTMPLYPKNIASSY